MKDNNLDNSEGRKCGVVKYFTQQNKSENHSRRINNIFYCQNKLKRRNTRIHWNRRKKSCMKVCSNVVEKSFVEVCLRKIKVLWRLKYLRNVGFNTVWCNITRGCWGWTPRQWGWAHTWAYQFSVGVGICHTYHRPDECGTRASFRWLQVQGCC